MSILLAGNAGVIADVDEARNFQVYQYVPGYPSAGGFYSVAGFTTAVVAAALAANTTLAALKFVVSSTRTLFLRRMRVAMGVSTAGAAGGIPTILGLQRFVAGGTDPTGGTLRTVDRTSSLKGSASDVTPVRDSNAALTTAGLIFGALVASSIVPNNSNNITPFIWLEDFPTPIEVVPGDGLALRTQNVGPATATWNYSYTFYWGER